MSSAPRPAAFLDRDGVIIRDFGYVHKADDLVFIDGAAAAIRRLNDAGFQVIVVTNQSGVARGYFSEDVLNGFHGHMLTELQKQGARIDHIYYCPYHPEAVVEAYRADHPDRKPAPGMVLRAIADHDVDVSRSFLIGDNLTDIYAAEAAKIPGFLFAGEGDLSAFLDTLVQTHMIHLGDTH
jgi:D-glycero-D-manno-heptose 1,7-bisphosphate phosphatase